MQLLKTNNRVMAIIGLSISVVFPFLMSDWQSIPYDPCTKFSLFHHPDLANDYNEGFNSYHEANKSAHVQVLQIVEVCTIWQKTSVKR